MCIDYTQYTLYETLLEGTIYTIDNTESKEHASTNFFYLADQLLAHPLAWHILVVRLTWSFFYTVYLQHYLSVA